MKNSREYGPETVVVEDVLSEGAAESDKLVRGDLDASDATDGEQQAIIAYIAAEVVPLGEVEDDAVDPAITVVDASTQVAQGDERRPAEEELEKPASPPDPEASFKVQEEPTVTGEPASSGGGAGTPPPELPTGGSGDEDKEESDDEPEATTTTETTPEAETLEDLPVYSEQPEQNEVQQADPAAEVAEPEDVSVMELLNYGKATIPVVQEDKLVYPELKPLPFTITPAIEAFERGGDTPAAQAVRSQLGEEQRLAERLLRVAVEMQQESDSSLQQELAQKYTDIHGKLHGVPDEQIARDALAAQYYDFKKNIETFTEPHRREAAFRLMDLTHTILGDEVPPPEVDPRLPEIMQSLQPVVRQRLEPAIAVLETVDDDQSFTAPEIAGFMERCLAGLTNADPAWGVWEVKVVGGSIFSTSGTERAFRIGERAVMSGKQLKQTGVHEIIHGVRDNGSYRAKLPESLDEVSFGLFESPEEGTAMVMDKAYTGEVELSPYLQGGSMYLNTALAYGTFQDFPALLRPALTAVMRDRSQARGAQETLEQSAKTALNGAARFYRGTPASNEYDTGVSTIGILYRKQFFEVISTTHKLLRGGMAPEQIYDYYALGNFNPTDGPQNIYMAELYKRANDSKAVNLIGIATTTLGLPNEM